MQIERVGGRSRISGGIGWRLTPLTVKRISGDLAERHDRYLYGRSFWVAISSKRDQEAVLWENSEGYRRFHADRQVDVCPSHPDMNTAAAELYRSVSPS